MRDYHFDHAHLRSSDPEAAARLFDAISAAQVTRGIYTLPTEAGLRPLISGSIRLSAQDAELFLSLVWALGRRTTRTLDRWPKRHCDICST